MDLDAFALDVLEARGLCVGLLLGLLEGGRLGLEVRSGKNTVGGAVLGTGVSSGDVNLGVGDDVGDLEGDWLGLDVGCRWGCG